MLGELQDAELAEAVRIVRLRRAATTAPSTTATISSTADRVEARGKRRGTASGPGFAHVGHERAEQRESVGVSAHLFDRRELQHPRRIELAGVGPAAFERGADFGQCALEHAGDVEEAPAASVAVAEHWDQTIGVGGLPRQLDVAMAAEPLDHAPVRDRRRRETSNLQRDLEQLRRAGRAA